mgnify:CR=1 FL=1
MVIDSNFNLYTDEIGWISRHLNIKFYICVMHLNPVAYTLLVYKRFLKKKKNIDIFLIQSTKSFQ